MNERTHDCDLLCVSPQTDDAEIALGGTLAQLAAKGRKVWLHDLTRGELGSNGTPDERWAEAAEASRTLGIHGRVQGECADGFISVQDRSQVEAVAAVIRSLRPRWVVAAPMPNRHPDHLAIVELVTKAAFMARLGTWTPEFPPLRVWEEGGTPLQRTERWAVEAVFSVCLQGQSPSLVFDVGTTWATKLAALRCYKSQFSQEDGRRRTMINSPDFLEAVEGWARTWGLRAGVQYAEALRSEAYPVMDDLPTERWS